MNFEILATQNQSDDEIVLATPPTTFSSLLEVLNLVDDDWCVRNTHSSYVSPPASFFHSQNDNLASVEEPNESESQKSHSMTQKPIQIDASSDDLVECDVSAPLQMGSNVPPSRLFLRYRKRLLSFEVNVFQGIR